MEMWAHYSGNTWVEQQDIDSYILGAVPGSTPQTIADAVCIYCYNVWAIASYYADGSEEQNHSISDQLYSIQMGYPCIPVINSGLHAVVLKAAQWHRDSYGTPWTDAVWYHDPSFSYPQPNVYRSIAFWKAEYQSCVSGSCYGTIINIMCSSNPEASDAYNQYRTQGGTFYGEPPNEREQWEPYMI